MPTLLGGVLAAPLLAATHASTVDVLTFAVAATIVLAGAVGVVMAPNPVHAALFLIMTLFGVAVLFVAQRDDFLAVVQVIVYAGAVVVLFLFVIMFLGVDREENRAVEPLRGQRPLAVALVALGLTGLVLLGQIAHWATGQPSTSGVANGTEPNVNLLGQSVFTTYLFPFEVTSALLVIAVVGAVVLARRPASAGDDEVGIDATGAIESGDDTAEEGDVLEGDAADPAGRDCHAEDADDVEDEVAP